MWWKIIKWPLSAFTFLLLVLIISSVLETQGLLDPYYFGPLIVSGILTFVIFKNRKKKRYPSDSFNPEAKAISDHFEKYNKL